MEIVEILIIVKIIIIKYLIDMNHKKPLRHSFRGTSQNIG